MDKRVLVYCGLHNGDGLETEINKSNYDLVYGFDANPEKVEICKNRFTDSEKFRFFNNALTDKGGEDVTFNVYEKWDASSSLSELNPEYGHVKNDNGVLHGTTTKKVTVKSLNLGEFLKKEGIEKVDMLVTDLQGFDLTVIKTLEEYIRNQKVGKILSEVEWDGKPAIYQNDKSNKFSDFNKFFGGLYRQVWHLPGSEDWWETDMVFLPVKK